MDWVFTLMLDGLEKCFETIELSLWAYEQGFQKIEEMTRVKHQFR